MDKEEIIEFRSIREIFQIALFVIGENAVRPLRRNASADVEIFRFSEIYRGKVVVADDNDLATLSDKTETLARVSTVTDDIAQTDDLIDLSLIDQLEGLCQRLEVGVDIRDDSESHTIGTAKVNKIACPSNEGSTTLPKKGVRRATMLDGRL